MRLIRPTRLRVSRSHRVIPIYLSALIGQEIPYIHSHLTKHFTCQRVWQSVASMAPSRLCRCFSATTMVHQAPPPSPQSSHDWPDPNHASSTGDHLDKTDDAVGAPVEQRNPLGYSVNITSAILLNVSEMIGVRPSTCTTHS